MQILPSGGQPPSGLELAPFRGLRYAEERVGSLARVTSPPYDVIGPAAAAALLAGDPHNVVRLVLPTDGRDDPASVYASVAETLRGWQADGIVVPDARPALYVYEQDLSGGPVLQRGLVGALRLVPPGDGAVVPHEDVVTGPVTGRRMLMEATQANLEPIYLLYDGPGPSAATALAADVACHRPPLVTIETDDGMVHRMWAVTDPGELASVTADLAQRRAMIADGHHRYAAYLQLQERRHAAGDGPGPWDAGLALLVDQATFPPQIGAIHRVVNGLGVTEAVDRAEAAFKVSPLPALRGGTAAAALDVLAQTPSDTAFVVSDGTEFFLLTCPDPAALAAATPGRSERWRRLSAAVRQELLFARLWGVADDAERVEVNHDAGAALQAARSAPLGTAVLCPRLSAEDVREVASHGERVPRKSTSFTPKPRTGLVMRSFALG